MAATRLSICAACRPRTVLRRKGGRSSPSRGSQGGHYESWMFVPVAVSRSRANSTADRMASSLASWSFSSPFVSFQA